MHNSAKYINCKNNIKAVKNHFQQPNARELLFQAWQIYNAKKIDSV